MRELDRAGLDRYITGNWGEDQFKDEGPEEDIAPPICYVDSETDCDGELYVCENCGRTMCFSHSAKASDYSGQRVTYCAECAGRP